MTATRELYDLGEHPPLGTIPLRMHAQVLRQARYGQPAVAFQHEVVPVPQLAANDVLVRVMAAGINYNNVWAALGVPVVVVRTHKQRSDAGDEEGYHIGGSDASGVV